MDKIHYEEMVMNLNQIITAHVFDDRDIYVFGHCNATEELIDLLNKKAYCVKGILDNNPSKQGQLYKEVLIMAPQEILRNNPEHTIVFIVSRAYESMAMQLRQIGYLGKIEKLVEYNSFAEYSLTPDTIGRKWERVHRGIQTLICIKEQYCNMNLIVCPFAALGDVYYAMAYLPYYLKSNKIKDYVVIVVGRACKAVADIFAAKHIEVLSQKDMDELVQAILFTREERALIAHHDRPYTNSLTKVLNIKKVPFEVLYKSGVYGLEQDVKPYTPTNIAKCSLLPQIQKGKAVILAPRAKSVAGVKEERWTDIIYYYKERGYQIFTNVVGDEMPLEDTVPINVPLNEMQSLVEYAGTFIGIRSGLCDVIKEADCKKIALYPDCYYSNTSWKVAEFFELQGWENQVVK